MSLDVNIQSAFTAVGSAIKTKISSTEKGSANGVATLDGTGKVPSSQLPSYVDDVVEYSSTSTFPATGSTGILYIALDSNMEYRWSGSTYVKITSGAVDSVNGKTGIVNLIVADIPSLQSDLDAKAPVSHSHEISNITGLSAALDAKATNSALSTLSSNIGATDTDYVSVLNAALA